MRSSFVVPVSTAPHFIVGRDASPKDCKEHLGDVLQLEFAVRRYAVVTRLVALTGLEGRLAEMPQDGDATALDPLLAVPHLHTE